MNRSTRPLVLSLLLLGALSAALSGQAPGCGILQGTATTSLPDWSGTLPASGDMTTALGSNNLYVLTQWGFTRSPLTSPTNPAPYAYIVMGQEGGSGSPGIIPIKCDCHQGSNTMDVAEAPDGTARMISDWQPYWQGGPDPGGVHFSGFAAQVAKAAGSGNPSFGQQIDLPGGVPLGSQIAAIYVASTGKHFGYFPVTSAGVYLADITNPTGDPSPGSAIQPSLAIGWHSGQLPGDGARLRAVHVSISGYDKYLLAGATQSDDIIHVAEIDPTSGIPVEVASVSASNPTRLEVSVVNGEIFIFSAASSSGLQVFKFLPPNGLVPVTVPPGIFTGYITRVELSGPAPFPALSLYRDAGGGASYVDIYDSKWVQGGTPILARSLRHAGATDANYRGGGFANYVKQNGSALTSYVYREVNPPPPGLPTIQPLIHTDTIDVSCIAADPTAPPVPYATMTNLSANARPSPENSKNYFGDKWSIADSSVSFLPILQLDWDFHNTGPFAAEKIVTGADLRGTTYGSAYWPCDELNGGHLVDGTGTGCYASLGAITPTYQLALQAQNQNPQAIPPATFVSPSLTILQPQISIVGYDGATLSVLAGNPNNGDASGSQGNVAEATFTWTFTPGGVLSGPVVTVPASATSFSLMVDYKGGYSTSKGGAVQQVDLVPNFSLSPNPVLKSSALTLRNLMQKAAAATLNSVSYAINSSPPLSGTLASSFLVVNGTAPVTAPAAIGSYTITLTYNYTDHLGAFKTAPVALPFSVTDFQPIPVLGVYKDANHTQPVFPIGNPPTFNLTTGTTYYLFDDETLPNGVTHPGASFYKSTDSNPSIGGGDTLIGTTPNAGPQTFASVPACTGSCYVKVSVQGTVRAFKYATGSPPPPPPPGCPPNCGTPTVALTGPVTGTANVAVTFTATATGFPGSVSYSWDFGDGGGSPPPPPPGPCPPVVPHCNGPQINGVQTAQSLTPGPATNSHTYTANGTYTVTVQASSGSTVVTATQSITIGVAGPPAPKNTFGITGATFNTLNNTWNVAASVPVTFTALEPDAAATFAWDFGDGGTGTGRSATHAFFSAGTKTVTLTATGGGTATAGTSVGTVRFTVSAPSFQAIMIPGAGSIESPSGNWATDLSVTNPGNRSMTVTLYFAAFTDVIPSDLSTLPFDSLKSVLLDPGQSWSGVDVVGDSQILNRHGAGKGLLLARFTGGDAAPIVTVRVYFTSQGASFGTALPSYLVGPFGQLGLQQTQAFPDQVLVGLRDDSLYRFNVSLFNASSQGGLFHLEAFTEQGDQVASKDYAVAPYDQAGLQDTDLFTPDPAKRYVLKVTGSTGSLQAFASVLDRRNNDLVQVADDTPRVAAAPGATVDYYIAGVGRIEDQPTNTHWRTDLRFFNTSTLPRNLVLEFHYTPVGSTVEKIVLASLQLPAGQGTSIDDFVGTFLNQSSDVDLTVGTVLGLLKVSYQAPTDVASAPLIIGGRIYADLSTGTAGMQLSTYSSEQTVPAGGGMLVMPGAQTNLRFRTNIGLFAAGDLPTTVQITAKRKNGDVASTFGYVLNDPGKSGAFAQVPMTALANIDGDPMAVLVQSLSGSPVGAYIVTVDQVSTDTVFIQGKKAQ
jgi:PKD repeat protein